MYGVEAAGHGIETGKHSAPLNAGHVGVLHGNRTYLMSDAQGQIIETHSISAGLDYPGVGPEHSFLKDMKRVNYVPINDTEALQGFRDLTQIEGIIPALEAHMPWLTFPSWHRPCQKTRLSLQPYQDVVTKT